MGKYFTVAVFTNGEQGTIWFDDEPKPGDSATYWHYNEVGLPVSKVGVISRLIWR